MLTFRVSLVCFDWMYTSTLSISLWDKFLIPFLSQVANPQLLLKNMQK